MGRPRLADIDTATTERILEAAEAAFASQGFAGTRLEDIAQRAGVRRPSLLYHFPSKDVLYEATVKRVFATLRDMLIAAISSQGTFSDRLEKTVGNYTAFIADRSNLSRIFVREVLDAGGGRGSKLVEEQVAPLLDLAEGFVKAAGKKVLRPGVDIRGAILQIVGGAVLYAIAGPLRPALWNEPSGTRLVDSEKKRAARYSAGTLDLVRTMVFADPPPARRAKKAGKTPRRRRRE